MGDYYTAKGTIDQMSEKYPDFGRKYEFSQRTFRGTAEATSSELNLLRGHVAHGYTVTDILVQGYHLNTVDS